MEIIIHEASAGKIAEIISDKVVIKDIDDTLTLIAESGMFDAGKIIMYENQMATGFYNLRTGLAGEVLQKFSNYRVQLAIIGDFSKYKSKSFQDFIRECNKGNRIFFLESQESAISKLTAK